MSVVSIFYLISDEHLIEASAHFFFLLVMLRLGHIWVTWLILSLGGIPERVIVLLLHAKSTHENTESTSDDLTAPPHTQGLCEFRFVYDLHVNYYMLI